MLILKTTKASTRLLILLVLILSGCVTDYYFEVNQVKYAEFFPKPKHIDSHSEEITFYNKMKWTNYPYVPSGSIFFPDSSSGVWFNIKFLCEPNISYEYLSKAIGDENYLVSFIQFHPDISNIKNITVEHIYDGSKLKSQGTYILDNKELQPFSPEMINAIDKLRIYFIFDYPTSWMKRFFTKKKSWFPKEMIEQITITYEIDDKIETKVYQFNLKWMYVAYWIT